MSLQKTWPPDVRAALVDAIARLVLRDLRERPPALMPEIASGPHSAALDGQAGYVGPSLREMMLASRAAYGEVFS